MVPLFIVVVLVLLLGGGGGYCAHSRYRAAPALGGILGTELVIALVFWLIDATRFT